MSAKRYGLVTVFVMLAIAFVVAQWHVLAPTSASLLKTSFPIVNDAGVPLHNILDNVKRPDRPVSLGLFLQGQQRQCAPQDTTWSTWLSRLFSTTAEASVCEYQFTCYGHYMEEYRDSYCGGEFTCGAAQYIWFYSDPEHSYYERGYHNIGGINCNGCGQCVQDSCFNES